MTFAQTVPTIKSSPISVIQRFFIWTFALTICWLVLGFPIVALQIIGAPLVAMSIQPVFPYSAIAIVISSLLALNILLILIGATLPTIWGLYPQNILSSRWWHFASPEKIQTTFAACPLTCERSLSNLNPLKS